MNQYLRRAIERYSSVLGSLLHLELYESIMKENADEVAVFIEGSESLADALGIATEADTFTVNASLGTLSHECWPLLPPDEQSLLSGR